MKKVLALALVVAITATASIAGTLAYLTDRDSEANIDFSQGLDARLTSLPKIELLNEMRLIGWIREG